MIENELKIPLYPGRLVVIVCDELKDGFDRLGIDPGDFDSHLAAFAAQRTYRGKKQFAVVVTRNTTLPMIAHECKHVVNMIFDFIGQALDLNNDEAECYLLEWIFAQVYKIHDQAIRAENQN